MLIKIFPLLLLCSFDLYAGPLITAPAPRAYDDHASVTVALQPSVTVDVTSNDLFGTTVTIAGSTAGTYGSLSGSGPFTYTLYDNATNAALAPGQIVTDTYTYTYANDAGQSASARIIIQVQGNQKAPVAVDDNVTVLLNASTVPVAGNVITNDKNATSVYLNSSPVSKYGTLILNSDGSYTYTLWKNAPSINKLLAGEIVTDSFSYTSTDQYGQSATAKLNIKIIGNPVDANGNTVYSPSNDGLYDNVDVEFNDRSAQATPLNSGRNIKGSLFNPGDKDWYRFHSAGNEIIKLDVCPSGSSCSGKKSWVLYVFDSKALTLAMEERSYNFSRWVDETGSTLDLSGKKILNGAAGTSNDMYLAYRLGYFDGALIGVVDPCFDTSSSVEIGVGAGERDYFVAVSVPLMGGDSAGKPTGKCGDGSIVLHEPGISVSGLDADGKAKTYTTTQENISAFPYSDDQYTINITSSGLNPLLSTIAAASSATFNANNGELKLPKVRILDGLYDVRLLLQNRLAGSEINNGTKFDLSDIKRLGPEVIADAFQSTYNSVNQQVIIPRVTDTASGKVYSYILQYHPEVSGNVPWLEAIVVTPIQ